MTNLQANGKLLELKRNSCTVFFCHYDIYRVSSRTPPIYYYFREEHEDEKEAEKQVFFGLHFSDVMVIIYIKNFVCSAILLYIYIFLINEHDYHFERQALKNIQMMANNRNNHQQSFMNIGA